jgi:hypothetical protein
VFAKKSVAENKKLFSNTGEEPLQAWICQNCSCQKYFFAQAKITFGRRAIKAKQT